MLLALGCYLIPDFAAQVVTLGRATYAVGPGQTAYSLLDELFSGRDLFRGFVAAMVLTTYGVLGAMITILRVRKEMTP